MFEGERPIAGNTYDSPAIFIRGGNLFTEADVAFPDGIINWPGTSQSFGSSYLCTQFFL